ncbi:flagellar hook-associated protein FlgL [Alteromonas halophila]|uniref:Flagellar hook-associated protein 3 n=1 Tax=Alteromonas halophila TaxID=516698 RepID=A0A918MVE3_9ALTE|nr:flagellar hook-associated protein FlgL [Alteromonas halophila]GGW73428.1 flagellar hook-associated protein 3 [Alteromonas halophila]
MRISTNQIYNQNIRAIMDNQQGLVETQQELSTGKKLNSPSDDPVGAAKVIRFTEELDQLKQFQRNNDLLTGSLEQQEAVLDNVTETAKRARVLTLQAGSGILTDANRKAIASELKQLRDEMLDLMNSQDADGNYIYSGHQAGTQAFTMNTSATGNTITFAGDGGNNFVQVADSARIQSSTSGQEVFENVLARLDYSVTGSSAGATVNNARVSEQATFDTFYNANYDGNDATNNEFTLTVQGGGQVELTNAVSGVSFGTSDFTSGEPFTIQGMQFSITAGVGDTVDFELDQPQKKNLAETVNDLYEALSTPGLPQDDYQQAIDDALIGLDNGMEKVALEQSSIGGRLNTAESIYETNLDLEIAAKEARSSIEDVDYAEASAEFSRQETALQAALASFPRVSNLSLFDYIS